MVVQMYEFRIILEYVMLFLLLFSLLLLSFFVVVVGCFSYFLVPPIFMAGSCAKVSLSEFHSGGTRLYTNECVERLKGSETYKKYCQYKIYHNSLYFLWFVGALALSSLWIYMWYFYEGGGGPHDTSLLFLLTFGAVVYLLPVSALLSFVGYFEDVEVTEATFRCCFLSLIAVVGVTYNRGSDLSKPCSVSPAWLKTVVWDIVSIELFILPSYLVALWRSVFWGRIWMIPAPLLTIPALVGVSSLAASQSLHSLCFTMVEGLEPRWLFLQQVQEYCRPSLHLALEAPESFFALQHFLHPVTVRYSQVEMYQDPHTLLCALVLSTSLFAAATLRSAVFHAVSAFSTVLPTHPTTWGLLLLCTLTALGFFFVNGCCHPCVIGCLSVLLLALLHHGFENCYFFTLTTENNNSSPLSILGVARRRVLLAAIKRIGRYHYQKFLYLILILHRSLMKFFALLFVLAVVLSGTAAALQAVRLETMFDRSLNFKGIAEYVNHQGKWQASHDNGRLITNITLQGAKKMMGVNNFDVSHLPQRVFTEEEKDLPIPESFDSALNWPDCPSLREIRDQSSCGSCWAIAAAAAITDRYCTVLNQPDIRISTANLLSCCFVCGLGCNGGWPAAAWMWWVWVGLATEQCQPYPFPACSHHSISDKYPACPSEIYNTPTCNITCTDPAENFELHQGEKSYAVVDEENYQRELMTNGPFEVALTVYEDFLTYKSGVYTYTTGEKLGGHAVKLVGWGVLDGVPYWKIANSWNDDWGDNGYILVERGNNECGIEKSGVAGVPKS
eukprot:gene5311-3813_t